MNEFEIRMLEKGMLKNIQAKMDKGPNPKKEKREHQPESDQQAFVNKGVKLLQAIRNWIAMSIH